MTDIRNSEAETPDREPGQLLVREIKPLGPAWMAGRQAPPGQPPATILVSLPVVVSELVLQRYGPERYSWLYLWPELVTLNRVIVANDFKLFVHQPNPAQEPAKLFVSTLGRNANRDEAYSECIDKILHVVSAMTRLFTYSFEPMFHEALTFQIPYSEAPEAAGAALSIGDIELVICGGTVSAIITPLACAIERVPFQVQFGPDERIITIYGKVPRVEGHSAPQVVVRDRALLRNLADKVVQALSEHAPDIEEGHLHSVTQLFNAAISMESLPIGYLLLWQVLESTATAYNSGELLVPPPVLARVREVLAGEGLVPKDLDRVEGSLCRLHQRGDVEVIAEMVKKHVYPERDTETLAAMVRGFRKTRGTIVHDRGRGDDRTSQIMDGYLQLREVVTRLIGSLSSPMVRSTGSTPETTGSSSEGA